MAKITTTLLCITTLLVFLTIERALARPEPAFHDVTPMETHHVDNESVRKVDTKQDNCEGLGEDECMMRRTLEAHLDYIYTQKQNHH